MHVDQRVRAGLPDRRGHPADLRPPRAEQHPTWAESLALLLVLYVTMLGAAVGVRDAGHIGFESLVDALPAAGQRRLKIFIHLLVLLFGALMAWNCALLAESCGPTRSPTWASPTAGSTCPRPSQAF
ncbi:TRAP transporter small permease subunit [Achromobacter insuavis]